MSFDSEQLRTLIHQAACGTINRQHLSKLVQIARVMCEAHLRYVRPSALRFGANQGLTPTELAYDCLGTVFARDATGCFHFMQSLVAALHAPLDEIPGDELVAALRASIASITDRHLAQLYAFNDPSGTKIKRNIRNALKNKNSCMSLSRDFRGTILQPTHGDPLDEYDPFPVEDLQAPFP